VKRWLVRLSRTGYLRELVFRLRLWWRLLRDPRVPEPLKLLVPAAALIYILWPMDIFPDLVPVFGQMDDVAVVILALNLFERLVPASLLEEHMAALYGSPSPSSDVDDSDVIDADFRILR